MTGQATEIVTTEFAPSGSAGIAPDGPDLVLNDAATDKPTPTECIRGVVPLTRAQRIEQMGPSATNAEVNDVIAELACDEPYDVALSSDIDALARRTGRSKTTLKSAVQLRRKSRDREAKIAAGNELAAQREAAAQARASEEKATSKSPAGGDAFAAFAAATNADARRRKLDDYQRFAVVTIGDAVKVVMRLTDGQVVFLSKEAFIMKQAFDKVEVVATGPDGQPRVVKKAIAPMWLDWELRRTFDRVVFEPHGINEVRTTDPDAFNLWSGWSVPPVQGDWSNLRQHIFENVCRRNPYWFAWLMCWIADIVRNPGEKPGTAVVVKGPKGTGKSKITDHLRRLMRLNSHSISKMEQVFGDFNRHQAAALLTVLEEVFWAGDKAVEGKLKDMVTSSTQMINGKHVNAFEAANHSRYWLNSNSDWVVPVSRDERRFAVFEIDPQRQKDFKFFKAIDDQMNSGGLEALMFDLSRLTKPDWIELRDPPKTPWLSEQLDESLSLFEKWWLTVLATGEIVLTHGDVVDVGASDGTMSIETGQAYDAFERFCKGKARRVPDVRAFGREMAAIGAKVHRPNDAETLEKFAGRRVRMYVFGSLDGMRQDFRNKYAIDPTTTQPAESDVGDRGGRSAYAVMIPSSIPPDELDRWKAYGEGGSLP